MFTLPAGVEAGIDREAIYTSVALLTREKAETPSTSPCTRITASLTDHRQVGTGEIWNVLCGCRMLTWRLQIITASACTIPALPWAVWIKIYRGGRLVRLNGFTAKAAEADDKQWIWLLSGGKFKFHLHNRGVDITWIDSDFFGFPELDRWYHLALVKQGNLYTHYLDGDLFGEKMNDTPISDEINNPLTIGAGPGEFFLQGFVDEAFITRQPLAQNDIRNHFTGGIQGVLSVEFNGKLAARWGSLKTGLGR